MAYTGLCIARKKKMCSSVVEEWSVSDKYEVKSRGFCIQNENTAYEKEILGSRPFSHVVGSRCLVLIRQATGRRRFLTYILLILRILIDRFLKCAEKQTPTFPCFEDFFVHLLCSKLSTLRSAESGLTNFFYIISAINFNLHKSAFIYVNWNHFQSGSFLTHWASFFSMIDFQNWFAFCISRRVRFPPRDVKSREVSSLLADGMLLLP